MRISMIVAMGPKGAIGLNGKLPWHISEELKNFKALTMGHTLLMGRKTFESIGSALPGRHTLVLSRQVDSIILPQRPDAKTSFRCIGSWHEAIEQVRKSGESELFVCGGAEIYRLTFPDIQRIYLTRVDYSGPADTFFPLVLSPEWTKTSERIVDATDTAPAWTLTVWDRS